jgi:alcohol dehydrogenase class IV
MLGSLYAGLAFSNAGLGLVHAMAHTLGGRLDIAHGESNSILISRVVEFNFETAAERYAAIGEALGLHMSGLDPSRKMAAFLDALEKLRKTLNVDLALGDVGVEPGDIPELAAQAMKDPCVATNPRRPTQKEIEGLYEKAL